MWMLQGVSFCVCACLFWFREWYMLHVEWLIVCLFVCLFDGLIDWLIEWMIFEHACHVLHDMMLMNVWMFGRKEISWMDWNKFWMMELINFWSWMSSFGSLWYFVNVGTLWTIIQYVSIWKCNQWMNEWIKSHDNQCECCRA